MKPQVKTNTRSECNINSDLPSKVVPTKEYHLSQRGDRNVPLRYIKGAEWVECKEDQDLSPGYYALNDNSDLIPIEFDFKAIQWGVAQAASEGGITIRRPAPIKLGLQIYNEEQVDRSQWGPRDGTTIPEEAAAPLFWFGSENGETPDPGLQITTTDKSKREEQFLAHLAQLIPSYIDKPIIPPLEQSPSLAAQMSQITATTTRTSTSLLAQTIGAGVSSEDNTGTASYIWQRLQIPDYGGSWSGSNSLRKPNKGKGIDPPGDPSDGNPGGGRGGGDPPDPNGAGVAPLNPNPDQISDKLIGNEPKIFNGERDQVKEFLTSWNLYHGLNQHTNVMRTPFNRANLFLGYIWGPQVKAWVQDTNQLITEHLAFGGKDMDEWIWTTVINDFTETFQDHMSKDLARGDIFTLKMEQGNLDKYIADFKHVVWMGEYNINKTMVCQKFFQGLPQGLQGSMINFEPVDRFTHFSDWVEAAIRQHKKYQRWQNDFGGRKNQPQKPFRQKPTRQQWQQKFAKDPNCNGLAQFVQLGPFGFLTLTTSQPETQHRQY